MKNRKRKKGKGKRGQAELAPFLIHLGRKDKELLWIEGTKKRFKDGYNYFGRYPEKIIAFFEKHMKQEAAALRKSA